MRSTQTQHLLNEKSAMAEARFTGKQLASALRLRAQVLTHCPAQEVTSALNLAKASLTIASICAFSAFSNLNCEAFNSAASALSLTSSFLQGATTGSLAHHAPVSSRQTFITISNSLKYATTRSATEQLTALTFCNTQYPSPLARLFLGRRDAQLHI